MAKKRKAQICQRDFDQPDGRSIPLTPKDSEILREQFERFKAKFGREPAPDDPIFFDEDADEPRPMTVAKISAIWEEICDVMADVGIDPGLVYSARKCGFLVTEENRHWLEEDKLREWNDAMEEYYAAGANP